MLFFLFSLSFLKESLLSAVLGLNLPAYPDYVMSRYAYAAGCHQMLGVIIRGSTEQAPKLFLVGAEFVLISRVDHETHQGEQLNLRVEAGLHNVFLVVLSEGLEQFQVLLHQLEKLLVNSLAVEINQIGLFDLLVFICLFE